MNKNNEEIINCLKSETNWSTCIDIFEHALNQPDVNYQGLFYEVFEILGKQANFTTNYQISIVDRHFSKSGIFINQNISFYRSLTVLNVLDYVPNSPFFYDLSFGIYVTPSEFYTNYEKLLLPFDATTWIFKWGTNYYQLPLLKRPTDILHNCNSRTMTTNSSTLIMTISFFIVF